MKKELLKKTISIVVAIEVLALTLGAIDIFKSVTFKGEIERPKAGTQEIEKEFIAKSKQWQQEIRVNISPKKRSKKEASRIINKAKEEIDNSLKGKNESLDNVVEDLNVNSQYQNGYVTASWEFDNSNIIQSNGVLLLDNIKEDTIVTAQCTLNCDDVTEVYELPFVVKAPSTSNQKGFEYLLKSTLEKTEKSSRKDSGYALPREVNGTKVSWKIKDTNRGLILGIFGLITGGLIILADKEQGKRDLRKRMRALDQDYPDIVSMLSLYVGAGVTLRGAINKIATDYRMNILHGTEPRPGFEGISILQRQMEDGKGEKDSYREFGKRMNHRDYRKLSMLLVQNLRKGTATLTEQLEKEEIQAFEQRKLRVKILGEEASTKLLIPMMGLLMIVLIILIFPAISGLGI